MYPILSYSIYPILDQLLGRHKSANPNMVAKSFNSAFYMYFLLKWIRIHQLDQENLDGNVTITSTEIEALQCATHLEQVFISKSDTKFCVKRFGTIKYSGPVQFAPGEWEGIELNTDSGAHDGSLHGVRYFQTDHKRGVLLPKAKVSKSQRVSSLYIHFISTLYLFI